MEIHTEYIFTNEDLKNIKTKLPKDPCKGCSAHSDGSCCGCSDGREYYLTIKPFKEANILEYVLKYNQILDIHENITILSEHEKTLKKELENIGIIFNDKGE